MTPSVSRLQPSRVPHQGRPGRTRLGWFSTWNSKCGIAEYSKYLLSELDLQRFNWVVLAARDEQLIAPDQGRVIRCWSKVAGSAAASIAPLLDLVRSERLDILVVQFKVQVDFGFLSLYQLESLIACCHCVGTRVVMILHATDGADPEGNTVPLHRIAQCLSTVDRIFVHSSADIARLRAFGVESDIEQFPHGNLDLGPLDRMTSRQAHQLPYDIPIIGSYGFFLPHKGIDKLISALALLRAAGTRAKLVLVNALYPIADSERHVATCHCLAAQEGVSDDVIFETRYLRCEESLRLLAACDVIVYPYQTTSESSSAAVRIGLASRRPVVCSPLPIFSDVSGVVKFLRGTSPTDICEDLQNLLADHEARASLARRQAEWVEKNSWQQVAQILQEKLQQLASKQASREQRGWVAQYISDLHADRDTLQHEIAEAEHSHRLQLAELENSRRLRLAELEHSHRLQLAELEHSRLHWQAIAEATARQVQDIYRSRSWRVTRPLRSLSEVCSGLTNASDGLQASMQRLVSRWKPGRAASPARSEMAANVQRIAPLNDLSLWEQAIYLDLKRAHSRRQFR
jgi:glycosyltransferase involved in cell wall biosynthesis